jgi:hypothetical protein
LKYYFGIYCGDGEKPQRSPRAPVVLAGKMAEILIGFITSQVADKQWTGLNLYVAEDKSIMIKSMI